MRRAPAAAVLLLAVASPAASAAPFGELVAGAGLVSPFAEGALADVVREAAEVLGV